MLICKFPGILPLVVIHVFLAYHSHVAVTHFFLDFTNSHSCTFEHGQTLLTLGDIADGHVAEMQIT